MTAYYLKNDKSEIVSTVDFLMTLHYSTQQIMNNKHMSKTKCPLYRSVDDNQ
jgi:hypothetical protein